MREFPYLKFFLANFVFLLFFNWIIPSYALTITSKDITEINKHIDKDTLVVFDLDNTLIKNTQTLGSDEWFYHHLQRMKADGHTPANSLAKTVELYNKIQSRSKAVLVEPVASKIVAKIQKDTPNVIALTSRSYILKDATISQLNSVNINFNKGIGKHKFFSATPPLDSVKFYHGIGFTEDKDKGRCLKDMLEQENLIFSKIVFIDDKIKNVKSLEKMANASNIEYVGIHYTYVNPKMKGLDLEVAAIQEELMESIISDEEAKILFDFRNTKKQNNLISMR